MQRARAHTGFAAAAAAVCRPRTHFTLLQQRTSTSTHLIEPHTTEDVHANAPQASRTQTCPDACVHMPCLPLAAPQNTLHCGRREETRGDETRRVETGGAHEGDGDRTMSALFCSPRLSRLRIAIFVESRTRARCEEEECSR